MIVSSTCVVFLLPAAVLFYFQSSKKCFPRKIVGYYNRRMLSCCRSLYRVKNNEYDIIGLEITIDDHTIRKEYRKNNLEGKGFE
jgi:hypothetical protein